MKTRVLTALVLALIVLGVVFCTSPWPFYGLVVCVATLASMEVAIVCKTHRFVPAIGCLLAVGLAAPGIPGWGIVRFLWIPLGLLLLGILAASYNRVQILSIVQGFWPGAALLALTWLHNLTPATRSFSVFQPALLAMVPLWGGDTAAIFVGKAFGKHLLAPAISPKKTVEGAIANLLACIAVAIPLAICLNYTWVTGLACGLCAGILGQAGDLFESALKRRAGVKDSGTLLPGHGGILDRIDSLLFTAPAVAYILLR